MQFESQFSTRLRVVGQLLEASDYFSRTTLSDAKAVCIVLWYLLKEQTRTSLTKTYQNTNSLTNLRTCPLALISEQQCIHSFIASIFVFQSVLLSILRTGHYLYVLHQSLCCDVRNLIILLLCVWQPFPQVMNHGWRRMRVSNVKFYLVARAMEQQQV